MSAPPSLSHIPAIASEYERALFFGGSTDGGASRAELVELGGAVLSHAFHRTHEMNPAYHMQTTMDKVLSETALANLARHYGLDKQVQDTDTAVLEVNDSELARLFTGYVGAVDMVHGRNVVVAWMQDHVLSFAIEFIIAPGRAHKPHALSDELNRRKIIEHHSVKCAYKATGPRHALTWLASIYVDGALRGTGLGKTQSDAKEHASKYVLLYLKKQSRRP